MSETKEKTNKTIADKLWEEIKDKKVEMFALPNQTVSMYCQPVNINPSKLYLTYKASSLIASIEETLGPSFKVEHVGNYITVSKE